jgi:acyl-CoA dehydrogenase
MSVLIFSALTIATIVALALRKAPIWAWAAGIAALCLIAVTGLPFVEAIAAPSSIGVVIGIVIALVLAGLAVPDLRRKVVTRPAFHALKKIIPNVSDTEREALEAGTVSWDAELFSGDPDWRQLQDVAPLRLSEDERAFLEGPTEELCKMIDDWSIRQSDREIPDEIWKFLGKHGFFGMLISKEHGGLGFSPQAQSLVIGKVSSRSPDTATIVMVPNSLGPGELIEKYGTDSQKDYYLSRLTKGEEVPCFALTGPTSGSDAASMRDIGVVCKKQFRGKETLGITLNWDKRYISLGPNATILGLAFRLFDPDGLLDNGEDIGITLALVPTDHDGVEIGRRHLPCGSAFPNGPNWGKDVFIPMDWVIGGEEQVGQGWRMLMECLSAGRAISLPASGAAGAKAMLRVSSAYARIRKQFGLPIAHMEGIEEPLARLVEQAYVLESGRAVTASMVAGGEKPAVISALLKYQSTERLRDCVNDALDIHGGRGICDGPANYLQAAYQMVPVSITVEGANILTRTLITFAQGALRSHPFLYTETQALQDEDEERGFEVFEEAFNAHLKFSLANMVGAFVHNLTLGAFASAPPNAGKTSGLYKQLWRSSRSFALVADLTVAMLGGGLKVKQKLTGRLADALSELYLLSCVLKRYEDDGSPAEDLKFVEYCAANCLYRFDEAMRGVIDNFPVRPAAWFMRIMLFPLGARRRPASDKLGKEIVRLAIEPGAVRDRLTRDIFISDDPADPTGLLEHTLLKVKSVAEADRKLEKAIRKDIVRRYHTTDWIAEAESKGVLTSDEAKALKEVKTLVEKVIAVDHFDAADITGIRSNTNAKPESVAAE